MKKVAFFHNCLGKTDGVSLEVDKWRDVLVKKGHQVFYCAGNNDIEEIYCIPELSFYEPLTQKLIRNGTVKLEDYKSEDEMAVDIYYQAAIIKEKILKFIHKNEIEVMVPNNLLSVGYHIPAVIALSEVLKDTMLPAICHNHDFYYEESGEVAPTCKLVLDILDKNAPPDLPNVSQVVINKLAQLELQRRKNIKSRIIPNVFDFDQPEWKLDEFNSDFRAAIGVGENDLFFLQATRIMDRKGIELAIDLIAELQKEENLKKLHEMPLYNGKKFSESNEIHLVCSGYIENFGISGGYHRNLLRRAAEKNVNIKFVGDQVKHSRGKDRGKKIYSLWDSYVHADFVTYPSLWEGWGNQFIEAVFAKLPIFIFEYPVYVSDLKEVGFNTVSLGNRISGRDKYGLATVEGKDLRRATREVITLLQDADTRRKVVNENYDIAKRRYSCHTLGKIIDELFEEL